MRKVLMIGMMMLGGCAQYHQVSETPPTDSHFWASVQCNKVANHAVGPWRDLGAIGGGIGGAISVLATQDKWLPVYDECMREHGWADS